MPCKAGSTLCSSRFGEGATLTTGPISCPERSNLPANHPIFDPLRLTIKLATKRGLRVHAWINLLLVSSLSRLPRSKDHVIRRHPEWLVLPADLVNKVNHLPPDDPRGLSLRARYYRNNRNADGLFLDPALPEVQDHLLAVIRELLSSYRNRRTPPGLCPLPRGRPRLQSEGAAGFPRTQS